MGKGDQTAILSVIIGLAATMSGLAAAFVYPDVAPRVWQGLFWGGLFVVIGALLVLLDLHALRNVHKAVRITVPATGLVTFLCIVAWSYTATRESGLFARFVFPNPPQYWLSSHIRARYTFTNLTGRDVLISDLAVTEIQTNSSLYYPYASLDMCSKERMVGWRMIDQFNVPGTAPIKINDGTDIISTHPLANESVNEQTYTVKTVNIEKDKSISVVGDHSLYPEDWSSHNTVVICPSVVIRDAVHGDQVYVCAGMIDYRFPSAELANVRSIAPKDVKMDSVDHNEIKVGEIFAWRDAAVVLSSKGPSISCIRGPA
jgi:hypothetical protein